MYFLKKTREVLLFHKTYGGPLYKTGDLVKYLADGNIHYVGRSDFQVKIRGQRLEIGEVEAVILRESSIRSVLAMKREEVEGEAYLAAYIIPITNQNEDDDN